MLSDMSAFHRLSPSESLELDWREFLPLARLLPAYSGAVAATLERQRQQQEDRQKERERAVTAQRVAADSRLSELFEVG